MMARQRPPSTGAAGAGSYRDLSDFEFAGAGQPLILVGDDTCSPGRRHHLPRPQRPAPRPRIRPRRTHPRRRRAPELDSGIQPTPTPPADSVARISGRRQNAPPQFTTRPSRSHVTGNDLAELLDDLHHRHGERTSWSSPGQPPGQRLQRTDPPPHPGREENSTPAPLVVVRNTTRGQGERRLPHRPHRQRRHPRVEKIVRRFERYGLRYATADLMEDFEARPSRATSCSTPPRDDGLPGARMKTPRRRHARLRPPRQQRKIAGAQRTYALTLEVKFAYAVTAHKTGRVAGRRHRPGLPHRGDGRPRGLRRHTTSPRPNRKHIC